MFATAKDQLPSDRKDLHQSVPFHCYHMQE
jgi:hypothetical protein